MSIDDVRLQLPLCTDLECTGLNLTQVRCAAREALPYQEPEATMEHRRSCISLEPLEPCFDPSYPKALDGRFSGGGKQRKTGRLLKVFEHRLQWCPEPRLF